VFSKVFRFQRRSRVADAQRRNDIAAEAIGAHAGEPVRAERSGGRWLNGPPGLVIVTVRPGEPENVLRAQIDSAVAAGYPRPEEPARGFEGACLFPVARGLPRLHVEVLAPGRSFRVAARTVPAGHTGVVVSLHTHLEVQPGP
jgi:hypothetical protein